MSLRDFIRAAAQDVRAALKPTTETEAEQAGPAAGEKKKKEKKTESGGHGEDRAQKRRRRERAQKAVLEERLEETVVETTPAPIAEEEGDRPGEEEEEQPETFSSPIIEITDEGADQAGTSSAPAMYRPYWPNILEDSTLSEPIMRAEWVARSLPPSELKAYAWADTFDVCDIANRAAILVSNKNGNVIVVNTVSTRKG